MNLRMTDAIKTWIIGLYAGAIQRTTKADDRVAAIKWLKDSRDVLTSSISNFEKLKRLHALTNSRAAVTAIGNSVAESVSNYKNSKLPLSMKVGIAAVLVAMPVIGFQGAGIAAFGSAVGLPVLLLVFVGATGVTSIIDTITMASAATAPIVDPADVVVENKQT